MSLVKVRPYWIRVGSKSNDQCPYKRRNIQRKGHMMAEAKVERRLASPGMRRNGQGQRESQELPGGKEGSSL